MQREGLPKFDQIKAEDFVPAVRAVFTKTENVLKDVEEHSEPTWDSLIKPFDETDLDWEYTWSVLNHLKSVKNSAELRKAYDELMPECISLSLKMSQSKPRYSRLIALRDSKAFTKFNDAKKRIIESMIRSAEKSGIALEGEKKERFNAIVKRMTAISNKFSNNLLDSTKAFGLVITDKEDTEGWPEMLRILSAVSYAKKNNTRPSPQNGPWLITLDGPSYLPFMQHCRNRDLRFKVYDAYVTRASSGEFDNSGLIVELLKLRKEQAQLLGYKNYAEMSLSNKMAQNIDNVKKMIDELEVASKPIAAKEQEELVKFAHENGFEGELMPWDTHFWSERQREKLFSFTESQIRPYFPLPRVLDALFKLCNKLYGITIRKSEYSKIPRWHEDVMFFNIFDEQDNMIAHFYLDAYSRPSEKRGGAWMNTCRNRRLFKGKVVRPVIYVICNGTPAMDNQPSLMSFYEVNTLFHEFGHALQGMLTTVNEADAAGCNGVEWDAIELCSQFMENWCTEQKTMAKMTRHYKTGEPMPKELLNKVLGLKKFRAAYQMQRQMSFGKFDLCLNSDYDINGKVDPAELFVKITNETCAMPAYPGDKFLCAFQHVFANEYAAGYYSYKWAEVLSADCFAAFEEVGLSNEEAVEKTGRRFRDTFLALGGSKSPSEVFRLFRGRDPETKALLRHSGCLKSN
jgi:oligopeptidase A